MNFSNVDISELLTQTAHAWRFRKPHKGETEQDYQAKLLDFVTAEIKDRKAKRESFHAVAQRLADILPVPGDEVQHD